MKILIYSLILFLSVSSTLIAEDKLQDFSGYRYSPFQWVYPEYFLKADAIDLDTESVKVKGEKIKFGKFSAIVPKEYVKKTEKMGETHVYKSDSGNFLIDIENESDLMCSEKRKLTWKDYCSAFKDGNDYFEKLYTLTPDSITVDTPIGDLWVIHEKGVYFKSFEKAQIYKTQNFTAYVHTLKPEETLRKDITIFHNKMLDKYITMGTNFSDDNFVKSFLCSLEEN